MAKKLTEEQRNMVEANIQLAHKITHKILRKRQVLDPAIDRDDIFSIAYLGLIQAVVGYNPNRGYRFSTYAVPCITGTVYNYLNRKSNGGIRIPRRDQTTRHPSVYSLDAEIKTNDDPVAFVESMPASIDPDEVANIAAINAAITKLPHHLRKIAEFRIKDYTQERMAKELQTSQGSISRYGKRMEEMLREAMG